MNYVNYVFQDVVFVPVVLLSFLIYYAVPRVLNYFRAFKKLIEELNTKAEQRLSVLEERRKIEREYYSAVIDNLENTNRSVQAEAQALRLSSLRLRNLYDKNPSFMTRSELERAISELAPRLASLRTSIKSIDTNAKSECHTDCPICCRKKNRMRSCANPKCTIEWCGRCDKNIDRCPVCRGEK